MKICIVGAGAIGGWIGAKLALTGQHQVSVLARGETLAVLQSEGWWLQTADGLANAPVAKASSDPSELGKQDLVIVAVKGQSLADVAPMLASLIDATTVILPAMNGVPWWFCAGFPGFEAPLQSLDPTGLIAASIPLQQVLGCVVHASTKQPEPGYIQHVGGHKLIVGEPNQSPNDGLSDRVLAVTKVLADAGFEAVASSNIRHDIWYKLWGNMTMNPVSAITGATIDRILADPLVRSFCSKAMLEAQAIGAQIGCTINEIPEDRHAVTAKLGAFKTSMLQDVEAGRGIELDTIVGAAFEIGQRLGLPTDNIGAILGLARVFARQKGFYLAQPILGASD